MHLLKALYGHRTRTISLWLAGCCFVTLLFVWSLPGVIALRNGLMLLLLLTVFAAGADCRFASRTLRLPWIMWPLLLLSAWIVLHNSVFAWAPRTAWQESMQWFKSAVLFALGATLASIPRQSDLPAKRIHWLGLVLIAYFTYAIVDLALKPWTGALDFRTILIYAKGLASRDLASYLGTTLVAIMLADICGHFAKHRGIFPGQIRWRLLALLGAIGLTLATMTRNSLPVLAVLALVSSATLVSRVARNNRKVAVGLMLAIATITLAGVSFSARNDVRWSKLSSSLALGLDTDTHRAWLNQFDIPYPIDSHGTPVDGSAYLRVAWIKGLVVEISRYPLGVGYDRNAFGRALRADYGSWVKTAHGHSGLLDFTLGVGIPGGLLLVAFLAGLVKAGMSGWRQHADAVSLALLLFTLAYACRSLMDGIVRDHLLEQFMLLAGLLLALAHSNKASQA